MSQLSVDSITGRVAGTSPTFPNGLNVTNGANVTGVVTATSFSGAVTGAVTGDVTGNVTGSSGSCTGNSATATVATNAQGLTGSPNITVGTVAGTDATISGNATVSGNLTVNGTTTTIDTAVTAVDSLAVDGDVNVGAAISAADYVGNFVLDMYLFS